MSAFLTKSLAFDVIDATEEKDEQGKDSYLIKGLITTSDVDLEGDVVAPGAFTDSIKMRHTDFLGKGKKSNIKFFSQHKRDQIIGYPETMVETEKGIEVTARFLNSPLFPEAAQAYYLAKEGLLDSFSIGFRATKVSKKEMDGRKIRLIEKGDLIEFSLVSVPMNQSAIVESVKHAVEDALEAHQTELDSPESNMENKLETDENIKSFLLAVKKSIETPINPELDLKSLTAQVEMLNGKLDAFMLGMAAGRNQVQETKPAEPEKEEDSKESEPGEAPEVVEDPEVKAPEASEESEAVEDEVNVVDEPVVTEELEATEHNSINEENSQVKKGNNKYFSKFLNHYKNAKG